MKLELMHRWECPYSKKVRDFIEQNNLQSQIQYNEKDEGKVPVLMVDGKPMPESDVIIAWLRDNLLRQGNELPL